MSVLCRVIAWCFLPFAAQASETTSADVPSVPAAAVDFEAAERTVFSQFGEDGVIEKIFEYIPQTSRYAIEFGAGDGIELSLTRNLVLNYGWSALMIEGDEGLADKMKWNYNDIPRVKAIQAWVYPGNAEILFEDHGAPRDVDLLSIDIDSNDYYVWKVIHEYQPKVVMIEYNASFPPPRKMVIRFHPLNYWDGTDYYGASLQSMYELGKRKGYELVYCEKAGATAFFVAREYYDRFGIIDNSPQKLYRLPQFGLEKGGRAPNGRGWYRWETKSPKELVWKNIRIPKVMVSR